MTITEPKKARRSYIVLTPNGRLEIRGDGPDFERYVEINLTGDAAELHRLLSGECPAFGNLITQVVEIAFKFGRNSEKKSD